MKNIHFIGIGGISMSGLALILQSRGYHITGSDMVHSDMVQHLEEDFGIEVHVGHSPANIAPDCDTVVYSGAIAEDNPELISARERGLKVMIRGEMMGAIFNEFPKRVAISGTHGKTSTSSMISSIYMHARKDPTLMLGGVLASIGESYQVGHGDYMIIEACEFQNAYHSCHPTIGVITNVQPDHLNFFINYDGVKKSFHDYVQGFDPNGYLITGAKYAYLFEDYTGTTWTCSLHKEDKATLFADNIRPMAHGIGMTFDCYFKGQYLHNFTVPMPGDHYVFDALCAIGASLADNIPVDEIAQGLFGYRAERRFEYKGSYKDIPIYDDYAHHPVQIKKLVESARTLGKNRVVLVFQPHTYSRTRDFLQDFSDAMAMADLPILTEIWGEREPDIYGVHSSDIVERVEKQGKNCYCFGSYEEIEKFLLENLTHGDVLITAGAGAVHKIAEYIANVK